MAKRVRITNTTLTAEAWKEILNANAEDVDVTNCSTIPTPKEKLP